MSSAQRKLDVDASGTVRFRSNAVVVFLLDEATAGRKCDLTRLWLMLGQGCFSRADMREFYQLLGYSVSGYGEVFHATEADKRSVAKADARAEKLLSGGDSK